MTSRRRAPLHIGLGAVLLAVAVSTLVGLAIKAPCISGGWTGQQYTRLCYTDIVPLLGTEYLTEDRLPYLDDCPGLPCDEYPVGTMYAMRLAAWAANEPSGFFAANTFLLTLAAGITAVLLYLLVGPKAMYFAAAPTLIIYGTTNWDLYAVALATAAIFLYLRKRNVWSGVMLGLGTAMKLYPILLALPLLAGRCSRRDPERDPRGGGLLAGSAAGVWLATNLPFMLLAFTGWSFFYRFNSERSPDWDSLWFMGCHRVTGELFCPPSFTKFVNVAAPALLVVSVAGIWFWKARREPAFPRWQLSFPILVLFLLTSKVYSPQYGLWLLPLFALALPQLRWFVPFQLADIAVFVTRFSFFGHYTEGEGLSFGWFELAIAVRWVILAGCVVAWVVQPSPDIRQAARGIEPVAAPA